MAQAGRRRKCRPEVRQERSEPTVRKTLFLVCKMPE